MWNIYSLNHGDWSCQTCPDFGMNTIALRYKNKPILREPKTYENLMSSPVLYGIPLLFPPNRTKDGSFYFEGKTYQLPINEPIHHNHLHGSLYTASFQIVNKTSQSITAHFTNNGTYFPFPFQMTIVDKLTDIGYNRTIKIKNIGNASMPVTFALHTTFFEPAYFSVPIGKRWICDDHFIPTGKKVALTPEQETYRDNFQPKRRCISGFYEAAGNIAQVGEFTYSVEGFDQWILYNGGGGKDYLCIEPQLGPVNALNTGGYQVLAPNQCSIFTLNISKLLP